VGEAEACRRAVDLAVETWGYLDGLVNAAGAWVDDPLIEADAAAIDRFVRTDVNGALQVTRAALPALRDAEDGGRLVHINGLQGLIRIRPPVLYAAVESAVRGLCESLRWEAAAYGVHVTLITLGSVANEEPAAVDAGRLMEDGLRRSLSRGEVADAVLFCLSRPAGVNVDELALTPLHQQLL
jgi:NADP-dependent 3-hydroxy acid dehydrogenase YdfG